MTTARSITITICALWTIGTVAVQRRRTRVSRRAGLFGKWNGYFNVRCQKVHWRRRVVGWTVPGAVPAIRERRRGNYFTRRTTVQERCRTVGTGIIQIYAMSENKLLFILFFYCQLLKKKKKSFSYLLKKCNLRHFIVEAL